jgi:hypothetical protein
MTAADFAAHVISSAQDLDWDWFAAIAPETQAEVNERYQEAKAHYHEPDGLEPITKLMESMRALAFHAYGAGVRHGAAAEQFRVSLLKPTD